METFTFDTALGPVPVWGDLDRFDPVRPLLLVIRGAFPDQNHLLGLAGALPHVDVAFVHLPGMHTPHFAAPSIRAFAAAFDEMLAGLFAPRPVNVLGLSMGGLVALGLRSPLLRSIIACDVPLTTGGLWPLRPSLLERAAQGDPDLGEWIWRLFGQGVGRAEERDYRDLLHGLRTPTRMLLGADPLEPERTVARMPSLVSEADRALYLAHPKVGVSVVSGTGHNIPREGQQAMMGALYRWLGPTALAPRAPWRNPVGAVVLAEGVVPPR